MTLDEMIAVLQAARAGKQIECRPKDRPIEWGSDAWGGAIPLWDFRSLDYRIKPEPREWIVWVDSNGVISQFGNYSGKGLAQEIKVREVL